MLRKLWCTWCFTIGMLVCLHWACGQQPNDTIAIDGWGTILGADDECTFTQDHDGLTVSVPAIYYDLWPKRGKVNAPLVLRETNGDFTVDVLIAEVSKAEPNTAISGLGSSVSFHAGTLVIWQDENHFARLDRTNMNNAGQQITSCYFHIFNNGERVFERAPIVPDQPTYLRLQRRGNRVTAQYSQADKETWQTIASSTVEFAENLRVGVAALNNTTQPVTVRFEKLVLAK